MFQPIAFGKDLPQELPDPLAKITAKKEAEKRGKKIPMTKEERLNAKNNARSDKGDSTNSNNTKSDNANDGTKYNVNDDEKSDEASALEKKIIGKVGKWTALRANPKEKIVCYAVLYAEKTTANTNHNTKERPYISIHYFSEGRVRFSAFTGHEILADSSVNISIDSKQYKLDSYGMFAISGSSKQDDELFTALSDAEKMLVRSDGENYSYSINFYDVQDFSAIFQLLQTHCDSNTNNSSFKGLVPTKKDLRRL